MSKTTASYLALLRGINVGGHNIIAKGALQKCFEDLGCERVRTYIQSGNILFRSAARSATSLRPVVEKELSKRFHYDAQVVVLSRDQYARAVAAAPQTWGSDPAQKHNAMFLLDKLKPRDLLAELPPAKPGIETITVGPGVIFWSASKKHLGKTTMMKLGSHPTYKQLTVRNHNTVWKLLELFDEL